MSNIGRLSEVFKANSAQQRVNGDPRITFNPIDRPRKTTFAGRRWNSEMLYIAISKYLT